jgi:6-pyruvoyltetrahydropterin/6-carboxytetrahydropterin synthase
MALSPSPCCAFALSAARLRALSDFEKESDLNYQISQRFFFDAAHTLKRKIEAEGSRRIHGHTYHCEVSLAGIPDGKTGMVSDLGLLRAHLDSVREQLDHHYLDEVADLGAPTLENLCTFVWRAVEPQFSNVAAVRVWRDGMGDACELRKS